MRKWIRPISKTTSGFVPETRSLWICALVRAVLETRPRPWHPSKMPILTWHMAAINRLPMSVLWEESPSDLACEALTALRDYKQFESLPYLLNYLFPKLRLTLLIIFSYVQGNTFTIIPSIVWLFHIWRFFVFLCVCFVSFIDFPFSLPFICSIQWLLPRLRFHFGHFLFGRSLHTCGNNQPFLSPCTISFVGVFGGWNVVWQLIL